MSCCAHCAGGTAKTACKMCNKKMYCGQDCARADWSVHQAACNVADVKDKMTVVAVPNAFQDVLNEKHFTVDDIHKLHSAYSIRHKAADGTYSHRLQESTPLNMGRLSVAPQRKEHQDYTIVINDNVVAKGNTLRDAIYERAPGAGGQLAATRANKGFTLWSKPNKSFSVSQHEPTTIRVAVPELDSKGMTVVLPATRNKNQYAQLSRKARGALEQQYKIKGLLKRGDQVLPLFASDSEGRAVRLLLDTSNPDKAKLLDVEYELPQSIASEPLEWDERRFACRANQQEDVKGLLLAVREKLDHGRDLVASHIKDVGKNNVDEDVLQLQDVLDGMESDYRIVNDHYQNYFERQVSDKIAPEVRSAIYRLVHDNNQQVGGIFSRFRRLLGKGALTKSIETWDIAKLEQKAQLWISEHQKAKQGIETIDASTGGKQRPGDEGYDKAKAKERQRLVRLRDLAKRDLNNLLRAVNNNLENDRIAGRPIAANRTIVTRLEAIKRKVYDYLSTGEQEEMSSVSMGDDTESVEDSVRVRVQRQ